MTSIHTTAELLAEIRDLRAALLDANAHCRSAFQVANRVATECGTHGLQANFEALADRLRESLGRQHDVILAAGGYAQPAQDISIAQWASEHIINGWLRAIDEAMVVSHLGVANADDSYEVAKQKLNNLIGFHADVATDPAVNGGYKLTPIEQAPLVPEGVRKVTLGFRWDSAAQHHVPTLEIEFEPVPADFPNDAKGWQDRDRLAAMIAAAPETNA